MMEKAYSEIEKAREEHSDGLEQAGDGIVSKANRAYGRAEAAIKTARTLIKQVRSKTDDPDITEEMEKLDAKAVKLLGNIYINHGHVHMVEKNFKEALRWLNRALALNPDNEEAKEYRMMATSAHINYKAYRRGPTTPQDGGW